MTRDVATVPPETSILQAVRLMAQRKISGVPVVDNNGAIVGMLSEGDLVRWTEGYTERQAHWLDMLADGYQLAQDFLDNMRSEQHKVKAVMAPGVVTITEDMVGRDIAHLMHTKSIKRVPVGRDGKLVGIVARSDLVRALAMRLGEVSAPSAPGVHRETVDEALRRSREEAVRRAREEAARQTGKGSH